MKTKSETKSVRRTSRAKAAAPATRRRRGRPSSYDAVVCADICFRISNGETLRKICGDAHLPYKSTVIRWLSQYPDFRDQYARARELQADSLAEEILEIADDVACDVVETKNGRLKIDRDNVQRSALRMDARKWFASKVAPKKYGDRVVQELSGPDGRPIETTQVAPPLPPHEVSVAVAQLIAKVERELGIQPSNAALQKRMKRILATGHMPPDLYAAMLQSRSAQRG